MQCCGKKMFENVDNFHCNICGKRVYKSREAITGKCPICKSDLYINANKVHCAKCGYRK